MLCDNKWLDISVPLAELLTNDDSIEENWEVLMQNDVFTNLLDADLDEEILKIQNLSDLPAGVQLTADAMKFIVASSMSVGSNSFNVTCRFISIIDQLNKRMSRREGGDTGASGGEGAGGGGGAAANGSAGGDDDANNNNNATPSAIYPLVDGTSPYAKLLERWARGKTPRDMQWTCVSCGASGNYGYRKNCHKCSAARPATIPNKMSSSSANNNNTTTNNNNNNNHNHHQQQDGSEHPPRPDNNNNNNNSSSSSSSNQEEEQQ